jgi:hypothetical protein
MAKFHAYITGFVPAFVDQPQEQRILIFREALNATLAGRRCSIDPHPNYTVVIGNAGLDDLGKIRTSLKKLARGAKVQFVFPEAEWEGRVSL